MTRLRPKPALFANLLLAGFLLAGPAGSLLHALEHEPGSAPSEVCSVCITLAQLGSADVASLSAPDLEPARSVFAAPCRDDFQSYYAFAPHQRGPPAIR